FISDACQGIFYLNHNFNFKMFTKSSFINYTIAGFPGRPGIAVGSPLRTCAVPGTQPGG
ncbi:MAG: hypothetical protein ACI8ZB_005438, partial [Desulforhopalus sp.]